MIAKIDHSISKTALVQEIQLYAYVAGQDPLAAANHHRHDEQMILVDKNTAVFLPMSLDETVLFRTA